MRQYSTRSLGQRAEHIACDFLLQHHLTFLLKNYRGRLGEIDLVMQERQTIIFVEVRYRYHAHFGGAEASVTYKKQQRIINTAQQYLKQYCAYNKPSRFDVVAISGPLSNYHLQWVQGAFDEIF